MYYWSENVSATSLEKEFLSFGGIREIYIGTAFFSAEGLRILRDLVEKNILKRSKIHIYLSDEFSQDKPDELLRQLTKIADVRVSFDYRFHAKVYWLKGETSKIIYGSSNFTAGGLTKNIEFDHIEEMDKTDVRLERFDRFFRYCEHKSVEVTQEVIAYYEEARETIEELRRSQRELKKKLKGFIRQDDEFDEDTYLLDGYFFTYRDYEAFFIRNQRRSDIEIDKRRKDIQSKMLLLHKKIYPEARKLGVECHWNPDHITSMTRPCEFNKFKVAWMGVRYGKKKKEIDLLNQCLEQRDRDEIKGFQKHGCLQFCIVPGGFEVNLFLAVRHDAVDRMHIKDRMPQLRQSITEEIRKLQGHHMTWEICNEGLSEYDSFDIDNEEPEDFCDFLKKDHDGCESYLRLFFEADDEILKTSDTIADAVVYYFELLAPLYNAMVWRPSVK